MISEWFDHVPVFYWPVLCLEIVKFYIWAWADAETHGVARQMIVGVSYNGRIRVRFIEDAPAEDWQTQLSDLSAVIAKLTASSPFDWIEGPISEAILARIKLWLARSQPLSLIEMDAGPSRPLLDPG